MQMHLLETCVLSWYIGGEVGIARLHTLYSTEKGKQTGNGYETAVLYEFEHSNKKKNLRISSPLAIR